MLVVHAHWQPPCGPDDEGGVLFWGESSAAPQPTWQRGRIARKPRPKPHPFCDLDPAVAGFLGSGTGAQVTLSLPTTRSGPQPSPDLVCIWELDRGAPPVLAPWIVNGLRLPMQAALQALVQLPQRLQTLDPADMGARQVVLGADARYWHAAATLVAEILAAGRLLPTLVPAGGESRAFLARWLPVLDSPHDVQRLALLASRMPPICRAEQAGGGEVAPRPLLESFVHTMCDALARTWAGRCPPAVAGAGEIVRRWLAALFGNDPVVQSPPAQLQALASSLRAWMRNLHISGDASYRIAFRLEAPLQRAADPADPNLVPDSIEWQLHYLLQAADDLSLLVAADTVWQACDSVLQELGHRFEQPHEKLLAGLGYAARLFPPLAASLKEKRPSRLSLDTADAYTFLRQAAPVLQEAGFGLLVPPWWNKPGTRLGVRLHMKSRSANPDAVPGGLLALENLVEYRWELALGETTLTREEFEALAELKSPLVQIRGQWVVLDAEQVEAAIRFWDKQHAQGEVNLLDALRWQLEGQAEADSLVVDEVTSEGWLAECLQRLKEADTQAGPVAELPQPPGLQGTLRPYQRYGFSWLNSMRRWGLGVCLADDMGLGKTIQTLALLLHERASPGATPAPTLLICPTSVVTNWEREAQRFAPSLKTMVHQGAGRMRGPELVAAAQAADVVLTSYAVVRQDSETLRAISWRNVILDEAQNIKNPSAKQTQAICSLPSALRLALTGTPVENRLSELWSIMHFLNPGYLGSREGFRKRYALPIENYHDTEATQRLKQVASPFILRRVKTDPRVIQDLPEKIETKVYCHLTEEQATLYEAVVLDVMTRVEQSEGIERRGLVLSLLTQLKQICNHPAQYLHQVNREAGPAGDTALDGRSGKLERLLELLEEALEVGDRVLIFSQYAEMGRLLADYLPGALGYATQFLHGGVPAKQRDVIVRRFQEEDHAPPMLILSLKAGGTGLNLTRASHVFHYDRWWNPAVEDQATDRAFRIGQKRNVQVHKLVTTGTLEEMIDTMIENKKGLAQSIVGSGEQWLTELAPDELRALVQLRRE